MALSAPIFQLKRMARAISRSENIPLHEALDRVAAREGFQTWSALSSDPQSQSAGRMLYDTLEDGDMLLLGARPRQGKTALALRLLVEAMKRGQRGVFFTLEYTELDVANLFSRIGVNPENFIASSNSITRT